MSGLAAFSRSARKRKGSADRAKSGGSGQGRLNNPRPVRPRRTALSRRRLRGQHPRQSRCQTPGQSHPRGPVTARPPTSTAHQAARRQRPPTSPSYADGYIARNRPPHRSQRRRIQHHPGLTPLGDRTQYRLAVRLPPADHPPRTPHPPVLRLPHPTPPCSPATKNSPKPNETRS